MTGELTTQGLYPAEHRALRELHATARQLASHWTKLAGRLGGPPAQPLREGATTAVELLGELADRTAEHGLHGYPAAQGVGGRMATLRNTAGDLLLERNQALRLALLDVQHVRTLLDYLASLADGRLDARMAGFHREWEARLREAEDGVREALHALARAPDAAVGPADSSPFGRAGHGLAHALGTVGEAVDGSPLGRAARRLTGS